jgi:hypothetical protein
MYILNLLKKKKSIGSLNIEQTRQLFEKDREKKKIRYMELLGTLDAEQRLVIKNALDRGAGDLEEIIQKIYTIDTQNNNITDEEMEMVDVQGRDDYDDNDDMET